MKALAVIFKQNIFAKQRAEMWAACLDFTRLPCLYLLSGPGYFQSLVYKLITWVSLTGDSFCLLDIVQFLVCKQVCRQKKCFVAWGIFSKLVSHMVVQVTYWIDIPLNGLLYSKRWFPLQCLGRPHILVHEPMVGISLQATPAENNRNAGIYISGWWY